MHGHNHAYEIECLDKNGNLKWKEKFNNIVVNTGLDEILNQFYKGAAYTPTHFIGLTDGTPTVAAGDTIASHVGWTEITAYSEATREAFTPGAVASQSVDNSASKASFSINGTATVVGILLATNSTKGGATGILIGAGAFTGGDKAVASGDTLNVTLTCTAS